MRGGFEKGYGATVYLHTPGLGALPIGLSSICDSPMFSFHAASDTDIEGVFALFDEIDAYLRKTFPHTRWSGSILGCRPVRSRIQGRGRSLRQIQRQAGTVIDQHAYVDDMIANMDYP